MSRKVRWLLVVGLLIGALAAGLVVMRATDEEGGGPSEIAQSDVFSTDKGDPVDVAYGPDEQGRGCMNVGGFFYASNISCFDLEAVDDTGSYVVAIPESKAKPSLVVGVLPAGANAATVSVQSAMVPAETRGRWFLASLPPGVLGPDNDASVDVAFSGQ